MPQITSAKKRVRVTARQTAENQLHRSRSRTAVKHVRSLLTAGQTAEAVTAVATAQSYLDKAAKTRALHPNTAARYKSRLAGALKASGSKEPIPPKRSAKTAGQKPAKQKVVAKKSTAATPAKPPVSSKAEKPVSTPPRRKGRKPAAAGTSPATKKK